MAEVIAPTASPITVPSDATPTLANNEAVNGAIIGSALGGSSHEVLGAVVGSLVGGEIGKERMQNEFLYGRQVQPPGSLGVEATLSAFVAGALGVALGLLILGTGAALLSLAGFAAVGIVIGALYGVHSNNVRHRDYENAQAYYMQHGGNYQGREREAQPTPQITQADMDLLKQRLAARPDRSAEGQLTPSASQR